MRKYGFLSAAILMIVASVLLTGCQKSPDAEQTATQQAIEAAKQGEAEKYAQSELAACQATMDQAKAEIETQKAKWMPKFEHAKELLAQAKTQADAAKEAAIANKEKGKNEATQAITDAKAAIAAAQDMVSKAPKGKGTKADLEQYSKDLEGYTASVTEAEAMMGREDYFGARDKAKAAMDGAAQVSTAIGEAMAKMAEKKGGHKGGAK